MSLNNPEPSVDLLRPAPGPRFGRAWAVAALEFRTTVARPLWWVLVAGAAFTVVSLSPTAFLPRGDGLVGSVSPFINSEYALTSFFGLSGFVLYSFFASILAGLSVIRDDEDRVSEFIHSTPLSVFDYLSAKFLGVLGALVLVLVIQLGFLVLFYQVGGAGGSPVGPFSLSNYIVPAIVFGLVPIIVFSSLSFAIGEWTRRPMMVYAIPVGIVFALPFFVTWSPPWLSPGANSTLKVFDPSGLRWLIQDVIASAPGVEFVNASPVPFDRVIWLNRLGLLFLSLIALLSTVPHTKRVIARGGGAFVGDGISGWKELFALRGPLSRFRRAGPEPSTRLRPSREASGTRLDALQMTTGRPRYLASVAQMLKSELRELFGQPALYLFIPLLIGSSLDSGTSAFGAFGDPLILTAGAMALSMFGIMTFMICAILLFFTVEAVVREQVTGFDAILYACPFKTSAFLLAKGLASAVLVAVLIGAATMATLPQLALQDVGGVELWPFLLVWGAVMIPTFMLWTAFITLVIAVVRERYTTYAVGLSVLLATVYSSQNGSLTWLTNWTSVGTLRWSDLGTFDLNGEAVLLNRLFVLSLAVFFTVVAVRVFPRVDADATASLRSWRPNQIRSLALRLTPFALLPLMLGATLAFQVRGSFQGGKTGQHDKDYWRQNVDTWGDKVSPVRTHVALIVELNPESHWVGVSGTYQMLNANIESIAQLSFTTRPPFDEVTWTVGGSNTPGENRSGLQVITLSKPLLPGESVEVGFTYDGTYPEGFTRNGGGVGQFVLPSGVLLHNLRNSFLPTPGFVQGIGITRDNYADPAITPDDFWQEEQRPLVGPYTTRIEISAPSEYTINAVGEKVAEYSEGDITTVVWESDYPVGVVNIVGGRWVEVREGGTAVFYHPGHGYNAEEMLRALVAARVNYSEWFYPYPWKELKLSEYPNQNTNAMGFPTNITFSEGLGFLSQPGAEVPTPFVVTAHEAAHQWWGNLLSPGEGPGTNHLVEAMATYSSLLLLEAEHGVAARKEMARQMETRYELTRRGGSELPLAEMERDQGARDRAVVFEKGAWVQSMLQDLMGREAMFSGLHEFIGFYVKDGSQPALQHMLQFLRPQAPDSVAFDAFVDQWFFDVVLPEFRIRGVRVTELSEGWEITATVENVGTGVVTVDVAAIAGGLRVPAVGSPSTGPTGILLEPGRPREMTWLVRSLPDQIVVDPDVRVLQRNRADAQAEVPQAQK